MSSLSLFLVFMTISTLHKRIKTQKSTLMLKALKDNKFVELQSQLYGRQGQDEGSTDESFQNTNDEFDL